MESILPIMSQLELTQRYLYFKTYHLYDLCSSYYYEINQQV